MPFAFTVDLLDPISQSVGIHFLNCLNSKSMANMATRGLTSFSSKCKVKTKLIFLHKNYWVGVGGGTGLKIIGKNGP